MRSAALESIGRADLIDRADWFVVGESLEREPAARKANGHAVRVIVNLSRAQKLALSLAAELERRSVSALIRDAALSKAGIAKQKQKRGARGRPLGSPSRRD